MINFIMYIIQIFTRSGKHLAGTRPNSWGNAAVGGFATSVDMSTVITEANGFCLALHMMAHN